MSETPGTEPVDFPDDATESASASGGAGHRRREPVSGTSSRDVAARKAAADRKAAANKRSGAKLPDVAGLSSRKVWALAAALAVLIAGIAGYWYWSNNSGDKETAQTTMCEASRSVAQAVVRNTHMNNPIPDDPIGALAVAANARLALSAGGAYLNDLLEDNPATPKDVAEAVHELSATLGALGLNYLAGGPEEARDGLRADLDGHLQTLEGLCS